jgi:hypothetical protein
MHARMDSQLMPLLSLREDYVLASYKEDEDRCPRYRAYL